MTDRAALEQSAETTMERLERRRKQKRISHASAVGTETRGNVAMLTLPWMNVTENAESKRSLVVHGGLAVQPSSSASASRSWNSPTMAECTSPFEDGYALLEGGSVWDCTETAGTRKDEGT